MRQQIYYHTPPPMPVWPDGLGNEPHYPCADEWRRVLAVMTENHDLIIALAIRQTPSKRIAAILGVSREAIDKRLRKAGFKNPPGVLGKPRGLRSAPPATIRSTRPAAVPAGS